MASCELNDEDDPALSCAVCMSEFDEIKHKPKFLACHHTLCLQCIKDLSNEQSTVRCPTCRQPTCLPSGRAENLQYNFHIDDIRQRSKQSNNTQFCSEHHKQADIWCRPCKNRICSRCSLSKHKAHEQIHVDDMVEERSKLKSQRSLGVNTKKPVMKFGVHGIEAGRLINPKYIRTDRFGNFYITESRSRRIQIFNAKGEYVEHWGTGSWEPGPFVIDDFAPMYDSEIICVQQMDNFLSNNLGVYSVNGTIEGLLTIDQIKSISDITLNSRKELLCADYQQNCVFVLNKSGHVLNKIGSQGCAPRFFSGPCAVCVGLQDDIIVAEHRNYRIQILDENGVFKRQFGSEGTGPGQFKNPTSVVVDHNGNILVSDWQRKDIQVFSYDGKFITCIDSKEDKMKYPCGLAISKDKHVMVVDKDRHCVLKFRYM